MKNSKTWILWLITSMAFIISNRNPIYLAIILGSLLFLGRRITQKMGQFSWLLNNVRFLGTMILLSAVINSLFIHQGNSIIFTFPESWLLIGGKITFESLFFGVINGLVIGSLYVAFNIFNLALTIKQITGLIPKIFHPIAITITIALTFFPSIQQRAREIKEAQIIRGNQMKRIVDWLPLFLPLLITSLENAFLLSESMSARGYHSQTTNFSGYQLTYPLIIGTFLIFSGWLLHLYNYPSLISIIFYILGVGAIVSSLIITSKKIKITRYYQETWTRYDVVAALLIAAALIVGITLQSSGQISSTAYSPYPHLALPEVQLTGIILGFSTLLPVVFVDK